MNHHNNKISEPEKKATGKKSGIFHQLQVILLTALAMATLYTAWTPTVSNQIEQWEGLKVVPTTTSKHVRNSSNPVDGQPLIGIVAGHWGNDSGTVCVDGLTEVDVNLNIASLVQKYLVKEGYKVDLLKEFDPQLTGYSASALVSIHADSCEFVNDLATGFKVAQALGSQRPEKAARLTSCLRNRYAQATGLELHSTSVTEDMTSYHAFGEINENTPAAIIETGFLNLDRQFLTQSPEKAAQGISSGILCFLNNESIETSTQNSSP